MCLADLLFTLSRVPLTWGVLCFHRYTANHNADRAGHQADQSTGHPTSEESSNDV